MHDDGPSFWSSEGGNDQANNSLCGVLCDALHLGSATGFGPKWSRCPRRCRRRGAHRWIGRRWTRGCYRRFSRGRDRRSYSPVRGAELTVVIIGGKATATTMHVAANGIASRTKIAVDGSSRVFEYAFRAAYDQTMAHNSKHAISGGRENRPERAAP